jgi:hypothetical protein
LVGSPVAAMASSNGACHPIYPQTLRQRHRRHVAAQ